MFPRPRVRSLSFSLSSFSPCFLPLTFAWMYSRHTSPFLSLWYEKSRSGAVNLQRVPAVRHYRRWLREQNQFSSHHEPPFSAPRGLWCYVLMLQSQESRRTKNSNVEIWADKVEKTKENIRIWHVVLFKIFSTNLQFFSAMCNSVRTFSIKRICRYLPM